MRVADETVIDIDGKNIWLWDIIDTKTRFLITTHMSYTRISRDAEQLMKQAYGGTGKIPRIIYRQTQGLPRRNRACVWCGH